jgi:alkanesulfonate monooxygenase SsuD/methylene tetrahydromethanopterin reductase-like flavin-dependent oxidoreductase (luciferase family)
MTLRLLRQGRLIQVPPVEEALRFLAAAPPGGEGTPGGDRPGAAGAQDGGRRGIVGDPERVRKGLEELAAEYGAEEVIVVTITHDHGARRRSYELIAEAFGLAPGASDTIETCRIASTSQSPTRPTS